MPDAIRQAGGVELDCAQRTHKVRLENEEPDAWWKGLIKNFPSNLFSSNGKLII